MQLIIHPGTQDEQIVELPPEGSVIVGRTEESTVRVLHKSLSRKHARLELDGGRILLQDLDSKNGTFVNEARVERCELREGDSFRCGDVRFRLASSSAAPGWEAEPLRVQPLQTRYSITMDELLEPAAHAGSGSALKVRQGGQADGAGAKLQVLLQVSQLLGSPLPIEELLERILQLAFQILEVDRAALLLKDAGGALRPRVARLASGETPRGPFYSQHIVDYVHTHNVAALFADARLDPRLGTASSVFQQSIRASMCAPLKGRHEGLGVLYVDNLSRPHGFTSEDLEFLTAFANQAAVALENSLLYRQLQEEAVLRNTYQRFFPPATLKKLRLEQGAPLRVVETEVTILFSDISGFTALSSTLEPRQVVELLNEYFPVMAEIVFRHEGTLEKYIGDALLAVWGAPFSHPDDVDRAVRAAVEMQQALEALNARWRARGQPEISIHVGLNTGRVAAGNIGSEQYVQYATIGDATNVASRVCSAAEAGEICLNGPTFLRWKERAWPSTPLPPVQVKGKQEPLALHRLEWREPARR
jgi:adenylate cyclase